VIDAPSPARSSSSTSAPGWAASPIRTGSLAGRTPLSSMKPITLELTPSACRTAGAFQPIFQPAARPPAASASARASIIRASPARTRSSVGSTGLQRSPLMPAACNRTAAGLVRIMRVDGYEDARETTLGSGLRVVTARRAESPSTAVGVWVRVGAVDEGEGRRGISHFLEHVVFLRGTQSRAAGALSRLFDDLGAEAGGMTSQEATEYRAHCLSAGFPAALEALADIAQSPSLDGVDLERARILDEIAAFEDDDEAAVDVLFQRVLYGDHPLGRRTIGEAATVEAIGPAELRDWHERWYRPRNMVVSAAGDVDHARLARRVDELFAHRHGAEEPPAPPEPPPRRAPATAFETRDVGQFQVLLGGRAPTERDPDFWPARLLAEALGGTASSRLWTRLGEELGLVYSVGAYHASSAFAGEAVAHVAMRPADLDRALAEMRAELDRLAAEPLEAAELARARNVSKADLLLEPRTPGDEQSRIGRLALLRLPVPRLEEEIAAIDAVTLEEARAAARLLDPAGLSVAAIGPSEDRFRESLARHFPEAAGPPAPEGGL
jgi:predicted Zn-dependent peptidase